MKKGEKRKKMLLKIGYDMFITRGYENTSVDEITEAEQPIKNTLFKGENVLMHHKVRNKLIDTLTPLLSEVIKEGVDEGIFKCDNITERVKMLLILSDGTFNEGAFSEQDIHVFIDITEKLLGAKNGTMSFIYDLIDKSDMEAVE